MADAVVSSSEVTKSARRLVRLTELCDAAGISVKLQPLIDNPVARARFIEYVQAGWETIFAAPDEFKLADHLREADVREFLCYVQRSNSERLDLAVPLGDVVKYYSEGSHMLDLMYCESNSRKHLVIALFFGFLPDGERCTHAEIAKHLHIDEGRVRDLKREGANSMASALLHHMTTGEPPVRAEGTPIQVLGLPARLVAQLGRHGIRTVETLTSMSADNLLALKGNPVGGSYLQQIEQALESRGICLRP